MALRRLSNLVARHPWDALFVLVVVPAIALGFVVTFDGTSTWDSGFQLAFSRYLMRRALPAAMAQPSWPTHPPFSTEYYGPGWELFLGLIADGSLGWLRDPEWARHAFNFALFPAALGATAIVLRRAGVSRATTALVVALLLADIRLGGSALLNTKDSPFALAFLVATLATWSVARAMSAAPDVTGASKKAAWLGAIAIVPTMLRPAVPLHVVACLALVLLQCVRRKGWRAWVTLPPAYLVAAWGVAWVLWPTARDEGVAAFVHALQLASRYPWFGNVRVFGHVYASTDLPRWYAFAWLPIAVHPLALALVAVGLPLLVTRRTTTPSFVLAEVGRREWRLGLGAWLGGLTALAWGAIVVARPILYDEDRHISFLYPPLLVLAGLGLDALTERARIGAAVALVVAASGTYAAWRSESYVYVSPLVPHRSSDDFDGDYWGLCIQEGMRAANDLLPAGAALVLPNGPVDAARLQMTRLVEGRFAAAKGATIRPLSNRVPAHAPYYVLQYNRGGGVDRVMNDVHAGHARLLWETAMPTGEPACALAAYE